MSGTTTYQVRYRVKGSTTWINYGQPITDLTEVISGLKPNTTYEMEVVATNPQGAVASNIVTFTTGSSVPPSAPGLPIASGISTTSLVLNWPASSSGAQPILYQPQFRVHNTGSFINVGLQSLSQSVTVTGLSASTSYDFQVVATNSNGSATSATLTVSTAAIGTAPSSPSSLRATNVTASGLTLSWVGSTGTPPITYQPRYRLAGTTNFATFGPAISGTTVNITGLAASTNYEFRVDAVNSVSTTPSAILPVTTIASTTAPSAPSGLTASNQSQTGITVSWAASTGTPAPTYQLQYRVGATGAFANYGAPISGTSVNVTGLVASTTYNFQVVASNSAGSATSTVLSAATTSAPVAPSAPLNPTIGTVTSSSIAVSWTHPAQGTDPLQYQLQWRQHPAAGSVAGLFNEDFSALDISETGGAVPSATITPASGGSITDPSGNVWAISSGAVFENGSAAGFTANVAEVALVNGVIWHENNTNQWYSWSPPSTWNPGTDPTGGTGTGAWTNHYAFGGSEYTLSANNEAQYYASSTRTPGFNPFSVSGGVLTITADSVAHTVANPLGLPYNSGAIISCQESNGSPAPGLFAHMYGYFEARCQLPKGRGLWPAFWLLPLTGAGEIDIFEQLGNDTTTIYCSLHATVGGVGNTVSLGFDASAAMHVYGCDWQADFITWYVDNVQVAQAPTPSDMIGKPYYILFNLAVGAAGSWPGPPDGTTVFPARMQIDYVHVFDKRPF
jgi:beta-glucanase (GH16 family)